MAPAAPVMKATRCSKGWDMAVSCAVRLSR
jgi:hypothetical protein